MGLDSSVAPDDFDDAFAPGPFDISYAQHVNNFAFQRAKTIGVSTTACPALPPS